MAVEIVIGKVVEVDCNRQRLQGALVRKETGVWEVSYELENVAVQSTRMKCKEKGVPTLLTVEGEGFLLPYVNRARIIVKVAPEYSVKYRFFSAGKLEDGIDMR